MVYASSNIEKELPMSPIKSLAANLAARIRSSSAYQAGFTMIELLVVIAVIGVLAVAVLSSINPIEQINKGRDTRTRSDAAQLINAVDRYYAIHEEYPWNVVNATEPDEVFEHNSTADWAWIDLLVDTSEVKAGFTNRVTNDNNIVVFKADGDNETMYACFLPTSRAFKQEAMDNCADAVTPDYDANGITTCPDPADLDADNLICLP
jgi:prepilin-type N-terminal cleavage/methylation domain-containing protein